MQLCDNKYYFSTTCHPMKSVYVVAWFVCTYKVCVLIHKKFFDVITETILVSL